MEDKRTIVAFLIIGIIIILMPYYLEWLGVSSAPSAPPPAASSSPAATAPIRDAASPAPAALSTPDLTLADNTSSFAPRDVVVSTPRHQLTFNTLGGVLTSARLPMFRVSSSQQLGEPKAVELVPPNGRGFVASVAQGDQIVDLSAVEFVPDREGISLQAGERASLRLVARLPGERIVEKVFHFNADRYGIDTEVRLGGFREDAEVFLGWEGGIARTEKSEETDVSDMRALAFINEDLNELKLAADDNQQQWDDKGQVKVVGIRNKYFLTALAPTDEGYFRASLRGDDGGTTGPNYSYKLGVSLGSGAPWRSLFYLGPLDYDELSSYNKELERSMNLGWPVIRQISALLMAVFVATYSVVPNYGWVIVLFAAAIKALVYPLTQKSFESANKMQQMQPKLLALREKFKNDPQRLSRETMKLYQEEGISPLGGCLPMLLQMPIFFALYNVFSNTIELRQAPFLLWIQDLSLPDEVSIAGFGLHILPLLMAVSMFFQSKMTMKDPKQAALVYLMPVMMIFIFWNLSSGLVLYWTIFNLLSIAQQWLSVRFKSSN
jgi:YidC/Oxa1 family membrane protein insertase